MNTLGVKNDLYIHFLWWITSTFRKLCEHEQASVHLIRNMSVSVIYHFSYFALQLALSKILYEIMNYATLAHLIGLLNYSYHSKTASLGLWDLNKNDSTHFWNLLGIKSWTASPHPVITDSKPITADESIHRSLIPTPNLPWYHLLPLAPSGSPSLPIIPASASYLSLILPLRFRGPSEQGKSPIKLYKLELHFQPWVEEGVPIRVVFKVCNGWFGEEERERVDDTAREREVIQGWMVNFMIRV